MTMQAPKLSVIIPAYYSYETIAGCLHALQAQTFRDFETIVINSSPEDYTCQIVTSRFPEVIFEQSSKRLLPHAARNRGVSLSQGELLIFTDPDCKAQSDWLAFLVEASRSGHLIVLGSVKLEDDGWFKRGVHLYKFFSVLGGLPPSTPWNVPTINVCYSREVWEAVGPFDGDRFCGDMLLNWRARSRGYQPWFEPRAIVAHRYNGNVLSFWRECLERGEDFAKGRVEFENWSRLRVILYLVGLPVLPVFLLLRAGRYALKGGWGWDFVLTLPIQLIGHIAWSLGEAKGHLSLIAYGPAAKSQVR